MGVLVDFACTECGGLQELWVQAPIPGSRPCPACGAEALRRFGGALLKGASPPSSPTPAPGPALCQTNPGVPGLCHMVPSAARSWVARARSDNRMLERELAYQERSATTGERDVTAPPVSHDHGPGGHSHGHGHGGHSHGAPQTAT